MPNNYPSGNLYGGIFAFSIVQIILTAESDNNHILAAFVHFAFDTTAAESFYDIGISEVSLYHNIIKMNTTQYINTVQCSLSRRNAVLLKAGLLNNVFKHIIKLFFYLLYLLFVHTQIKDYICSMYKIIEIAVAGTFPYAKQGAIDEFCSGYCAD